MFFHTNSYVSVLDLNQTLKDIVQQYLPFLIIVILQSFVPDIIYGISLSRKVKLNAYLFVGVCKLRGEVTRSR